MANSSIEQQFNSPINDYISAANFSVGSKSATSGRSSRSFSKNDNRMWNRNHKQKIMSRVVNLKNDNRIKTRDFIENAQSIAKKISFDILVKDWLNCDYISLELKVYMMDKLLPIIVLGVQNLLQVVDKRGIINNKTDCSYDPDFNPINFLAQFLLRNNPTYNNCNEALPYIRGMREVTAEARCALRKMEENRLTKNKAAIRMAREGRELRTRLKIQEQKIKKDAIINQFHEWKHGNGSEVPFLLVQDALRSFNDLAERCPEDVQEPTFFYFSEEIDESGSSLSVEGFSEYLSRYVDNLPTAVFERLMLQLSLCAATHRGDVERKNKAVILRRLFKHCNGGNIGSLDRRRIISLYQQFWDTSEDIRRTFRNPRKWPVVEPAEAQDYPSDVDEDDDLMTEEETVKSGPETSAVCQSAVPFLGGAVDDREGGNRDNVNVEQLQRTDEGSDGGDTSVAETTPDGDDGRAVANRLSEPSVLSAHEPDVSVEHAVYQSIQDPTTRFEPTDDYVGDINAVTPDHDKRTSPDASQHDDGNVIETPSDSNDVGSASADNSGEVGNLAISSAGMQLKRETIGAFDEAMEHKADNSASIRTDEHVLSKAEEEGYPESFNGPRDHDAMSPGVDTERGARDDDDGMARINADVNSEGGEISDVIHGARDADSRSLKAGNPIESCGNIEMDVHERSGKPMSGEATPDPLLSGIGLPHDIFSQDVNDDAELIRQHHSTHVSEFDESRLNIAQFVLLTETMMGDKVIDVDFRKLVMFLHGQYRETDEEKIAKVFKAHMAAVLEGRRLQMAELFDIWDNDGSGHVDLADIEDVLLEYKAGQEMEALKMARTKMMLGEGRCLDSRLSKDEFVLLMCSLVDLIDDPRSLDQFVDFLTGSIQASSVLTVDVIQPPPPVYSSHT